MSENVPGDQPRRRSLVTDADARAWTGLSLQGSLAYALLLLVTVTASAYVCIALMGTETGDSPRYMQLGENIARGNGFSAATRAPFAPELFRPPLYPMFLGALLWLGASVLAIVAVQVVLYWIATLFAVGIAYRVTANRLASLLLGVLLVLYLPIVRWVASITTEALCALFFCVACWAWLLWKDRPTPARALLLAVALIAVFFVRTTYVVLFPIVIMAALLHAKRPAQRWQVLVLALVLGTAPVGWLLRNRSVVPNADVSFGVGAGMVLHGAALEVTEPDVAVRNHLVETNVDVRAIHGGSDPATMIAADQRLRARALEVIRANMPEYIWRTARLTLARQWVEQYDVRLPRPARWAVSILSTGMLLLGYLGIYLLRRRWRATVPLLLLCVGVAGIHALFTIEARYTAPVRPVFYLFSAFALAEIVRRSWQRRPTITQSRQ